jgi:aminomethyltransferase
MNHHIIKGGHLSAQPMGALRDFVARDPRTEKPAVVNFPVMADNPYQVDVAACRELLDVYRPELVIFGRSMTITREPVAAIRAMVEEMGLNTLLMYDMAHVLGLAGPHFQEPFREGADLVTGSTHKTFFGTQRGVVAADVALDDAHWPLWEAIQRRTFPGSVSNHHLGTLVGLLMAAYEMNAFKDAYQRQVLANARALAAALHDTGLAVAGDRAAGFTETHQVIVHVGYAQGPEIARRLEDSNIIVNYQAGPTEEGFTASGALRMGLAEMTRFGMREEHMPPLAQLIHDVVAEGRRVREEVAAMRHNFLEMQFCFPDEVLEDLPGRILEQI